jgi:peptide chain release factor 1
MPSYWSKSNSLSTCASELGGSFSIALVERRGGAVVLRISGPNARALFEGEVGGHRWQRIPPNEKRGRVHSSTITVAVLDEETIDRLVIAESDLEWSTCRASGSGGQHLQKTDSAVVLVHIPTGIRVRSEGDRSQHHNRDQALDTLRERLGKQRRDERASARAADRRAQVGSGMRGDKRRTVRVQDDIVTDHVTGRTWRFRDYKRGAW